LPKKEIVAKKGNKMKISKVAKKGNNMKISKVAKKGNSCQKRK